MPTSKPRLLIVTHVDWDHAWQRPQALATALTRDFDVCVVSPVARRRAQLSVNPRNGLRVTRLLRLPGSLGSGALYRLNNAIAAWQVARSVCKRAPAAIVVTAPECAAWLPSSPDVPVVYDCMDDALAFAQHVTVRAAKAL
ncbi:MAG: hypothetical protein ABI440_12520, partial [Casimicrobiaceae bacterium]